jgi:hypothetical protein
MVRPGAEVHNRGMRTVDRPPLSVRVPYRLFGSRVPERYFAWAEADIRSEWWPWYRNLLPLVFFVVMLVLRVIADGPDWFTVVALPVGALLGLGVARVLRGRPGMRRVNDFQRTLAIRYQRGEISRSEQARLFAGDITWRMAALAAGAGALVFVVLYLLDRR